MTKVEIKHEKEVAKLKELEDQLTALIADTDNEMLQDKYLEWQQQRNTCNGMYVEWLKDALGINNKQWHQITSD